MDKKEKKIIKRALRDQKWLPRFHAFFSSASILGLSLIVLIGLCVYFFTPKTDPIDNGPTDYEKVGYAEVRDTQYVGFNVIYRSKIPVTPDRAKEIRNRPHMVVYIDSLKKDAPKHFGSMLYTDIYDFAEFAKKYDPDTSVVIQEIQVAGLPKIMLYFQPNPAIQNSAKYYDHITKQGLQYITTDDIYNTGNTRRYRYYKCNSPFSFSDEDEQFAHFSEDERIK